IKDNPELTAKNSLKGSTYPVEKTDNSNDKGSHPPIYQEEQKPSPDTTIPPAMEMANNQEIRAPKQPDRTRRQSRRQPRRQPRKQPRKQPIATLPAAVPTLKTEPLTVPSLQLDQSPCIKTRIDNIIPRKNDLSKQNEDRELLEHISDILDISISVYDRGTGQSNLTANGETAPCADNTTYAQPEKAHIKHRNIIEAKQKCTITSSKTQRNTLPLFRFMESDRPRLDSREVRDTRTYYQNKLDDLIINKKLPVVFAGSIACLKQMHALWGKNVIDRITPQPWPEIIDKETLESALTPRDTDLLVASKEQLDDVINAITDQMRNALLTQHKLNVSPKETRIYYNTECTVCKVTFEPHSTRKPGDVAYVVDLIAGPDFGTPESCNFSTISEANRTKRVDEIIMDEFRFITTVSLGGPKRACKAFARIFTLATLEYLEPRLDTLARFALLRVLNAYPAERIFKEYSNELRKRAFHVVCDNGKIIGARLQDS
ncbi:hypothetical protein, partial [Endozoicomonas sp.]|uniref:hypothetical protein n=1 Tax=Endozoicomonas sp. TaxID=1892382 RepID=UPI00383B6B3D